jgi:hypothetical protein
MTTTATTIMTTTITITVTKTVTGTARGQCPPGADTVAVFFVFMESIFLVCRFGFVGCSSSGSLCLGICLGMPLGLWCGWCRHF